MSEDFEKAKGERIPIAPEDPSMLEERKFELLQRLEEFKQAYPDSMSEVFFTAIQEDVRNGSDKSALDKTEADIAAIEARYVPLQQDPKTQKEEIQSNEEKKQSESSPELVRVTKDDVPSQTKVYDFYVVDENADPNASIIEDGSGKRLRRATDEEKEAALKVKKTRPYEGKKQSSQEPKGSQKENDPQIKQKPVEDNSKKDSPTNLDEERDNFSGRGTKRSKKDDKEEQPQVRRRVPMHDPSLRAYQDSDWNTNRAEFKGLHVRTVGELARSQFDSAPFSILAEALDPRVPMMMAKLQNNEGLDLEEMKILDFARHEYAFRKSKLEGIFAKFDGNDLEIVARIDPNFKALFAFASPTRSVEIFKQYITNSVMSERDGATLKEFEGIYSKLSLLRDSPQFKQWDEDVVQLCKQAGISIEDFGTTYYANSAADEKALFKNLQAKIGKDYTGFKRVINSVVGQPSSYSAYQLLQKAKRVRMQLNDANHAASGAHTQLRQLTAFLGNTINARPAVLQHIQQENMQNKRLSPGFATGPLNYEDAEKGSVQMSSDIEKEFDKLERTFQNSQGKDWAHSSVNDRTQAVNELRANYAAKENGGRTWFSRALVFMARKIFDSRARASINRATV